jgi:alpha-tubulin suppressor-like RCC1 family protein
MLLNRARRQTTGVAGFASRVARAHQRIRYPRRDYSQKSQQGTRNASSSSRWIGPALILVGTFAGASALYAYRESKTDRVLEVETPTTNVTFERPKTNSALSKEENRDLLSFQHAQVKKAVENPGVYAWGSNSHRVVDPDSNETVVKTPRRIRYFDGMLLRDLKLDQTSGAAITETGDLIQWGKGFSETEFKPTKTLTGKDLISVSMSRDRIIALASGGKVYSLPISKSDQESGPKPSESSWIPYWSSRSRLSYRVLTPRLGLGEKVTSISGGLEHVLLLTNAGRVFSAVAATEHYPSKGQLGIPGLTWATRPQGPVDSCHELTALRGSKIVQIASGDFHSLLLDKDGRVFVFGDNSFGQLGVEFDPVSPFNDTPTLLPLKNLYSAKNWSAKVTGVAAGGATSFMTVDAQRISSPEDQPSTAQNRNPLAADTWAFGKGIHGTLGNGRWSHVQDAPTKVKALSGLFEYDEKTQKVKPIRLNHISVGLNHAAAVLANDTHLTASWRSSVADTNWAQDALWWGGNEFFQVGTGKRSNTPTPTHINAPADVEDRSDNKETRFQIIPRHRGRVGGRKVVMEQRIECGRNVSAVFSAV